MLLIVCLSCLLCFVFDCVCMCCLSFASYLYIFVSGRSSESMQVARDTVCPFMNLFAFRCLFVCLVP